MTEPQSTSAPGVVRVERSRDLQAEEMVADPEGYFRRCRERAKEEAAQYVRERTRMRLGRR